MICTECATENEEDYLFCIKCGAKLVALRPNGDKDRVDDELGVFPNDDPTINPLVENNPDKDDRQDESKGRNEIDKQPKGDSISLSPSKSDRPNETNNEKSNLQDYPIEEDLSKHIPLKKPSYGKIDNLNFGKWIDGWADILEGAANMSSSVNNTFVETFTGHQLPNINVSRVNITENGDKNGKRNFHLIRDFAGSTVAVYIGPFGNDLFLTWNLYSKQSLKITNVAGIIGSSVVMGTLSAISQIGFNFFIWLLAILGWTILIVVGILIGSWVWYGDPLFFFFEKDSQFIADDLVAITIATHKSLLNTLETIGFDTSSIHPKPDFLKARREVFH